MNKPLWTPDPESSSNMHRYLGFLRHQYHQDFSTYPQLHQWSIDQREAFWESIWRFFELQASRSWDRILYEPKGMFMAQWFQGSRLNFAENLLRTRNADPAILYSNEQGQHHTISHLQLYHKVALLATALRNSGLQPGDRVAAILPNQPQAVIAMLATTALGAIWSCCSPDFGVPSLLDRFRQIEPRILFFSNHYHYKGKYFDRRKEMSSVIKQLDSLELAIAIDKDPPIDEKIIGYSAFQKGIQPPASFSFSATDFAHPVYILFSSGTTGPPKCIVHGAGGTLLQHYKELGLHVGLQPKDKILYYTSTGWMMWNWLVSSLALGGCIVLYDGCPFYPSPNALLDLVKSHAITIFGCSAKYLSALQKAKVDQTKSLATAPLRIILSTGSPLAPESFDYVYTHIKNNLQLCSISGGTDLISCFALGNPLTPVYRGELQGPGLGMQVEVFDQAGNSVRQQKGELVCSAAFPSMPVGFWQDQQQQRYYHTYFSRYPGVWAHGDYAERTAQGGLIIYGRSDATLNPGGIRIGTAEIYRQLEDFSWLQDSIAVGHSQDQKEQQRILLFVQLRPEIQLDAKKIILIKQRIQQNTSIHHVPAEIFQVTDIPKTYNGKLAELAVTDAIHGRQVTNLSALQNPQSLEQFRQFACN